MDLSIEQRERLAPLLAAIANAGLKITPRTEITDYAGSTYVETKKWPGAAVYTAETNKFEWLHTCAECYWETEYSTYDALKRHSRRHGRLCATCSNIDRADAAVDGYWD